MSYFVLYTVSTGTVLAVNTTGFGAGTGEAVLGPLSSNNADAVLASQYPQRFAVTGTPPALTPLPYWTTQAATASGLTTLTATLNGATTAPASATLAVASGTLTAAVSADTATWTLAVHPTLGDQRVPYTVSASGTVSALDALGSTPPLIGQQLATISGVPTVAPGGPGSRDYVLGASAVQLDFAAQLNAIAVGLGEALHLLHTRILPALEASTYTPITLSANESAALANLNTAVLPAIVTTLDAIYPATGAPMPTYQAMTSSMASVHGAIINANAALASIPNLQ